jgi:hypothetical protein
MSPATFVSNTSSFLRTSNRIKSLLRIGYPLILAISSDVSVFQVPGSPHVISRTREPNVFLTNSAKGSLNWRTSQNRFRQTIIKPFPQQNCPANHSENTTTNIFIPSDKAKLNNQSTIFPKRRKPK